MVRFPNLAPARVRSVVELIDLAPTVLDLMGLGDHAALADMEGSSLVPFLRGSPAEERLAFSRTLWNKPRYSVRDGRFKLIWDSRADTLELYDLLDDPGETANLVGDRRVTAGFMRQRLFQWLRQQEHLRAGAPAPESAVIEEELLRQLDALGYVQYLEKDKKKKK
jgi:arylsulfatase A-like enzyme